jgi:cell cycle checkpoint protein
MFYPTYLKLWRSTEELEGLVDVWATKMLKGEDAGPSQQQGFVKDGSAAFRRAGGGGGKGFVPAASQFTSSGRQAVVKPEAQAAAHQRTPPLLSLGSAARQELLLERLPYMAHIARRRRCSFGTMRVRDLERIVSFQGIGPLGAGKEDGEDGADEESGGGGGGSGAAESWATDKPTEEGSPRKRRGLGAILHGRRKEDEVEEAASLPLQSLVISDDDIEDD